jgi:hypothetical protein
MLHNNSHVIRLANMKSYLGHKCILALLAILLLVSQNAFAQKFGYIDAKFIISKMPEYKAAETEIAKSSTECGNWPSSAHGPSEYICLLIISNGFCQQEEAQDET